MDSKGPWSQYFPYLIQEFEMISLFILFMHFYRKAYTKKKKNAALKLEEEKELTLSESENASDGVAEQASLSSASSDEDRDERPA